MASPQAMFCFGILSLVLFAYFWLDARIKVARFHRNVKRQQDEWRKARGKAPRP